MFLQQLGVHTPGRPRLPTCDAGSHLCSFGCLSLRQCEDEVTLEGGPGFQVWVRYQVFRNVKDRLGTCPGRDVQ